MERGFKYRIYPNASQRDQIARTLGCCRFVYNRALDVKKSAYAKTGKTVSWAELSRMLPAWKRDSETSWLAQADSMALQQSVRDLDRAYKNFFRRVREGGKPGFPKFKSRRHSRQSYRTNGGKVVDRNHIALPKLGTVRAKVSRPPQGRFMSVTVSLDAAGRYFATFLCTDVPTKDTPATDRKVGIDLGVETLATLSDGRKIGNPRHLKKYERKLAREQRRLSRRKGTRRGEKPSGRYLKQRKRVARIHAKIADARTDTLHKVTTMLADENQVLCMEDLLGLRAQARRPAAVGTVMGLPRVRCAPRPRRQCGEKHTGGGETHPLQHGRYRGARGNRGGYSRLNARGEDVRPEGTVTVPDGRPRRTENPLVSTMGSVNLPCSVRLSLHCSCCSPSRS